MNNYIGKRTVLQFINDFKKINKDIIEELFTRGYCFWFAYILQGRFDLPNYHSKIYYNDIENHFICRVGKYFYDITGEIKNTNHYIPWEDYQNKEFSHSIIITKYCILKEKEQLDDEEFNTL